jgi:hypothetical protein
MKEKSIVKLHFKRGIEFKMRKGEGEMGMKSCLQTLAVVRGSAIQGLSRDGVPISPYLRTSPLIPKHDGVDR